MDNLSTKKPMLENEALQGNDEFPTKEERKGKPQLEDAMSSSKTGPSTGKEEMRLYQKRKLDKAKKKFPKKKRSKVEQSLEDDIEEQDAKWDYEDANSPKDLVLAGIADALAEKIDENARKSHLSTANVKSLLHHLLTDKLLVEFAQRVALDATDDEVEATNELGIETRLTRSKWKKSKKQDEVGHPKFFETDLEEDSEEDEEYDPDNEKLILPSDDDSIPTPHSAVRSPSLPKTPESQNKDPEAFEDSEHEIQLEGDSVFKVPGEPLSASKKKGNHESDDELIAYRTRSKISMKELSLEALTASLDPPDYDPALYDFNQVDETDPDDIEWKNWLNGLFQDNMDESLEENDEDFNFMASEEEVDQEEFRTDKGVKVSQKELQDLLDGILDEFGENIKDQSAILKYVIPKFAISDSQRLHITAQLQQHTQLLTQIYMLSYNDPSLEKESNSTKMLLTELASFRMAVDNDEQLKNRSTYYFAGLEDSMRIIDSVHEITSLERKLIERDAMPVIKEAHWDRRMNRDLFVDIPPRMALKMITEPFFATYPELLPEQGNTASKKMQMYPNDKRRVKFFKSEDNLLALGMEQFGRNFDLISKHLMPVVTPLQLKTKAKNLLSKRECVDNPIRILKLTNRLPHLESGLCINQPRAKPNKAIKDTFQEVSLKVRLPVWVDKFNDLLNRLGWCEGDLLDDLPVISMEVHYGKVYRAICPNGPLPTTTTTTVGIPKQPVSVLTSKKQAKIIVEAKTPCVLELTLPQQRRLDGQHRRKSKPRKVCKVARSVQTDGVDTSLSPFSLSPQADESESSFDSPPKSTSSTSDEPEEDPNSSRESPSPPVHSASSPVSLMLHQHTGEIYEPSRPMPIDYEKLLSPNVPQNIDQSTPDQLSSKSTSPVLDTSPKSSSNSPVSSSVERQAEPKESLLSEVCGITQTNEAVTYSRASSSCISVPTNVTSTQTDITSVSGNSTSVPTNVTSIPTNVTLFPTNVTSVPTNVTSVLDNVTSVPTNVTSVPTNVTLFPTNVTSVLTDATTLSTNVEAASDLRSAQTVNPVEQSWAEASSSSECFVASTPSPLNLSEGVVSGTDCLQDTTAEQLATVIPSEENADLQEVDKHIEKVETKEKDGTIGRTEQTEQTSEKFGSSQIDIQMSNMPDSTTSGPNEKADNEADPSSVQSITEPGSIDNGIEDAQESSFSENPVREGSASENDMSVGVILHDGMHAAEGNKLNSSDRTIGDSSSHGQRADSKESPKDKNSLRPSVNTRRKKPPRNSKFNWQEKVQEKASKFADLYFEKVKETLIDKPHLYCQFLRVIDEAGRDGMNRIEVYWKLSDLLADYPDLIELFVGFLEPSQAKEVGQFETWLEFDKARNLLLNCESFYMKTKFYHELLKRKIELHETQKDSKKLIESLRPHFRGNDKLAAEMSALFPDLPPPQSRSEDFEVIRYIPEKNGFDHVDEFEEMKLKPCDYVDAEDPQQKRKTILDDFAAWLQKPALNTADIRHDIKKPEAINAGKSDKQQGCCQDFSKENKGRLSFHSRLDISTERIVNQTFNSALISADEVTSKNDSTKHQSDLSVIENAEDLESSWHDIGAGELSSLYPNVVSMSESSSSLDNFKADEPKVISRSTDTVKNIPECDGASPVFDPTLGRRNQSSKQIKNQLSCSEDSNRTSLPDSLVVGQSPKTRDFVSDLLPSFQNDLFLPHDTFMSPSHMQDSLSMPEQINLVSSSLQTPISGKRESQKGFQNESPLGTKLTTFRINSKSSSKASGFQRIELMGDARKLTQLLTSSVVDNTKDGSDVGRNEGVNDLIVNTCKDISNEDTNVKKTDAISAGDVLYDETGQIIYKWSRDDDRLILVSCQKDGALEATFRKIAEQLNGRTMEQVQQRFTKLMELLSKASTS